MQLLSGIPDMGKIYVKYTAENLSHFRTTYDVHLGLIGKRVVDFL